jgi:hypothetical protein
MWYLVPQFRCMSCIYTRFLNLLTSFFLGIRQKVQVATHDCYLSLTLPLSQKNLDWMETESREINLLARTRLTSELGNIIL